jgi:hypothetical protein
VVVTLPGDIDPAPVVRRIVEAGGQVLRLVPHRESLEDLFVRTAKAFPEDRK